MFQVHPFDISDSSLMHLHGGVTHIKRACQCSLLPTLSGIMSYILGIAINLRYAFHVWHPMTMKIGKEAFMPQTGKNKSRRINRGWVATIPGLGLDIHRSYILYEGASRLSVTVRR